MKSVSVWRQSKEEEGYNGPDHKGAAGSIPEHAGRDQGTEL